MTSHFKKKEHRFLVACRCILFVALSIAPLFIIASSSSGYYSEKADCSLNFSWEVSPPFTVLDGDELTGYDIELLQWLGQELACDFNFSQSKWANTLDKIVTGRTDFSNQASLTQERLKFAYFSKTYREIVAVLYIRKAEGKKLKGEDLKGLFKQGFKLGLGRNIFYGKMISGLQSKLEYQENFVILPSEEELRTALASGKIDGFFATPFLMDHARQVDEFNHHFEEYQLEIIIGGLRFVFSRKTVSKDFVKRFNDALLKVQQSERYKNHRFWSRVNISKESDQ